MKIAINICLAVAVISLVLSMISRVVMIAPIPLLEGITSRALLNFTNTALLFAITLILIKSKGV